jgi:hypothetical protein
MVMAERMDSAAELRELCTSFAIQAGAQKVTEIVGLAEELRLYIQLGPEAVQKRGAGNPADTKVAFANGLRPDQLTAENDG